MKERATTRSEHKLRIREQAKRKVHGEKYTIQGSSSYKDKVESGLKQLRTISSEGGDGKAAKVRNELTYLLNNYIPTFDMRIEQLIDQWRRSGDPTYDISVRIRFRNARKEYMGKKNSL